MIRRIDMYQPHSKKAMDRYMIRCMLASNKRIEIISLVAASTTQHASTTLPETNIAHENPIFPGKYHQNCGFSMAMLVSGRVSSVELCLQFHFAPRKVGKFHTGPTSNSATLMVQKSG